MYVNCNARTFVGNKCTLYFHHSIIDTMKDFNTLNNELDIIFFHCKWQGTEVSEGLYRMLNKYVCREFTDLLDKHQIPWISRKNFILITIEYSVERDASKICEVKDVITFKQAVLTGRIKVPR